MSPILLVHKRMRRFYKTAHTHNFHDRLDKDINAYDIMMLLHEMQMNVHTCTLAEKRLKFTFSLMAEL